MTSTFNPDAFRWFLRFEEALDRDIDEARAIAGSDAAYDQLASMILRRKNSRATLETRWTDIDLTPNRWEFPSFQPIKRSRLRTGGPQPLYLSPAYCRTADCSLFRDTPVALWEETHDNDDDPAPLSA